MSFDYLSCPLTTNSHLTSRLHRATSTIDDLTRTLTSVSRVSSPDLDNGSVCTCCCGREDCQTSGAWAAFKSRLESRLVLSAEVGRALLERHEALVRRQAQTVPLIDQDATASTESSVDIRVAELVKQNALLEKRLTQALLHTEVSETSSKALLQELEEARTEVARLSSQNARAVGLENRLAAALQEKDDLQQELDSATQRARMTESRLSSYREKCAKLQAQVARLHDDLQVQRAHRQEISEELLSDAKQRLEQLQYHQFGHALNVHDSEVTKVLESLVADNEALKRDNAELQNLLAAEREELHSLQEELEERRANDAPLSRGHRFTQSAASFTFHDTSQPLSPTFQIGTAPTTSVLRSRLNSEKYTTDRRSLSVEHTRDRTQSFEPLTPETDHRPLSPESHIHAGSKWTSFAPPQSTYASSQFSVEDNDNNRMPPEQPRAQKPLLLLTRSRGVQTDLPWNSTRNLVPISRTLGDHISSNDGHSECSSLTDGTHPTPIGTLIDRTTQLLNRMAQADALTLTNRLKRQHLLGADVSHLSRTTVSTIVNDAAALRSQLRPFLEDDKTVTTCSRRDLRGLLKAIKDIFTELGQMRITLNDVILDPTIAGKVSEMAMNPSKANVSEITARDSAAGAGSQSWIAPISKLLGLPGGSTNTLESAASRALSSSMQNMSRGRPPPRIAPKLQPALSASATTVNVEFSGGGVGRAVTSTYSHQTRRDAPDELTAPSSGTSANAPAIVQPTPRQELSKSVMGIFAGAPRPAEVDPWVVVARPPGRKVNRTVSLAVGMNQPGTATIGRASLRSPGKRLSRIVDAVIDSSHLRGETAESGSDENDGPPPALERALRRGLSDSSIHTTFTQHGDESNQESSLGAGPLGVQPDRGSVLQALSRKMQTFRFINVTPEASTTTTATRVTATSRPQTPVAKVPNTTADTSKRSPPRAIPQTQTRNSTLFGLSSWYEGVEEAQRAVPGPHFAGSPRDEAYIPRNWTRDRDL